MESYLTEVEQNLIADFNANEELKEAVKKVLTRSIYNMGVLKKGKKAQQNINWLLKFTPAWNAGLQEVDPAQVGMKVMVAAEALAQLENAFEELTAYTKVAEKKIETNIAK